MRALPDVIDVTEIESVDWFALDLFSRREFRWMLFHQRGQVFLRSREGSADHLQPEMVFVGNGVRWLLVDLQDARGMPPVFDAEIVFAVIATPERTSEDRLHRARIAIGTSLKCPQVVVRLSGPGGIPLLNDMPLDLERFD